MEETKQTESVFMNQIDPTGRQTPEELARQQDEFVVYSLGVLPNSEKEAKALASDISALTGLDISEGAAALLFRISEKEREAVNNARYDETPSMGIDSTHPEQSKKHK